MANPWTLKNRLFWKVDPEFQQFNNRLYKEMWTFEETSEIAKLNNFIFNTDRDEILTNMKQQWLKYITEWNKLERIDEPNKIKGFAALTFLFIVLPYDKLDDVGKYFTNFEANMINIAYFYNSNGHYLAFEDIDELFDSGPLWPAAYQQWLDTKYNSACWWISYMIYEKRNNHSPIIDSVRAKLKS